MTTQDPVASYREAEDLLVQEHLDTTRSIEEDARALQATIAHRTDQEKRVSVLDRLFKRNV